MCIRDRADIANAADKFEQETAKSIWPVIDTIEKDVYKRQNLHRSCSNIWSLRKNITTAY